MNDMPEPEMVLGDYYDRPVVRTMWGSGAQRWLPVLGPAHQDKEILNFPARHFHADFRFMAKGLRESINGVMGDLAVFSTAISIAWPDVPGDHPGLPSYGIHVNLDDHSALERLPLESWYRVRRRRFNAHYPAYPFKIPFWLRELEAAYAEATLRDGLICPHKGASLAGMVQDEDGCITCPLHGLRWNARTGQLAPWPWSEG